MTNPNEFADRYVALWNESDPAARRKAVEELWAPEGSYFNFLAESKGHQEIAAQIGYAHDAYAVGGFAFRSSANAVGHHGTLRFNWVMVAADTGALEAVGFDFVVLDDQGRITADYQYIDTPPSYTVPPPAAA
ncbi:nuclear transport factor 2 family protein [Kitasatospora sp. NPDC049258]|uniref:nuclear transport factor 2 family protein n=1 Tax=Kitasatospora sp. NPDC049258 TaxID=3155394 RepID=UPI00342A8A87